jgi:hypothetical protein
MDVDDEGIDESSELAKRFTVEKYPGYCPTLSTGHDSGPDAIRVVVALHRFLGRVPNNGVVGVVSVVNAKEAKRGFRRSTRRDLPTGVMEHIMAYMDHATLCTIGAGALGGAKSSTGQ